MGTGGHELTAFQAQYDFAFDEFQLAACRALLAGHGVLLAAPTGSGKTVVGEFAVHLALARGRKCFYTTPVKALSNQKYADLARRYGAARVGLLTGDNSINGEADVVVMTTEVLRNMLYADSPTLAGLGHVVLDEVHYLADVARGPVWEEVIINLPESVALTALSATVSNAEELGDWLTSVRGGTEVIVEEHRPVPLWQHMLVGRRLLDLFAAGGPGGREEAAGAGPRVNPELARITGRAGAPAAPWPGPRPATRPGPRPAPRFALPRRPEVITTLDRAGLLPAITFIFSRAGCDAAVRQCLAAGLALTTPGEAGEIDAVVAERTAAIPPGDLAVLGFDEWRSGLLRGIAAHHAGLLPAFKETVEQLFAAGLVRAVFATETLAVGVNMPARTVVIERLDKWNGEVHTSLTAAEYTQLTGRAGRRGIDVEGHAVVLWQPGIDPREVAGLAGARTYPLVSSFRPSYNMAVNLVGRVGRERAARLLESSFAQFQADRAVARLAREASGIRRELERLAAGCDRGDLAEYARLKADLSRRERLASRSRTAALRAAARRSLLALRRGDIIRVPAGRRAGSAVVLEPAADAATPVLVVLTERRQVRRLSAAECPEPVSPLERITVSGRFNPRSPQHRRDLAAAMRSRLAAAGVPPHGRPGRGENDDDAARAARAAIDDLRRRLRAHPCHRCPDAAEHARQAERYLRLDREAQALERAVAGRTHVIARTFGQVCSVLGELGYLDGDAVTPAGRVLAGLYCELDLLAAECLRRGVWDGLGPADLAACASALTFEPRREPEAGPPPLPGGRAGAALAAMDRIWGELDGVERAHGLSFLREPDAGFARAAHAWASGRPLERVLGDDLTPGDFVRAVRQLIDLLGQVADAAGDGSALAGAAGQAVRALRRGVVAYSSVE